MPRDFGTFYVHVPEVLTTSEESRVWRSFDRAMESLGSMDRVGLDMSDLRYMTMEQGMLLALACGYLMRQGVFVEVRWPANEAALRAITSWGIHFLFERACGAVPPEGASSQRGVVHGGPPPFMRVVDLGQDVLSDSVSFAKAAARFMDEATHSSHGDELVDLLLRIICETLQNMDDHGGAWGVFGVHLATGSGDRAVTINLADVGDGITGTLRSSIPEYRRLDDHELLALAMEPGVSRFVGEGRGWAYTKRPRQRGRPGES